MEPLYQITVTCKMCEFDFRTSRVRPSFKKSIKTDTDFCMYYKKENENPEFYVVRVCPNCGFSTTESFSQSFTERTRALFTQRIAATWKTKDYGGKRTIDEAMSAYKLALISAQIAGESQRVIAGLLHHIAWLYRYQDDWEGEERFLRHALDSYIRVYETEGSDASSARLMYLIGELNRRLKQYQEAVKWFGRVINDKQIVDAGMIRACREGWVAAREDMLGSGIGLPEELESAGK